MASQHTDRRGLYMVAVATGIAWVLLDAQPWPARLWASLLLVPLPVIAAYQVKLIDDPDKLPRMALYWSSSISLWVLATVTAVVALLSRMSAASLGLVAGPVATMAAWALGCTTAGIALLLLARTAINEESRILQRLLPVSGRERLAFTALSVSAGFCEELVFRGFLMSALATAWGSVTIAAVVSSVVFGWMHAYQQPKGAVRAAALGAMLAVPVVLSGSVIPSMIAHTAIDLAGGIFLKKRLVPAVE